jgi:hypothetical protein
VGTFAPQAFGLDETSMQYVGDDAVGRALDRLFDAERAALLTDVVVAVVAVFDVALEELHNGSTTVRICGQYPHKARGRKLRGKRALFITHGYSNDHCPDLKQLLFLLKTSATTVGYRCNFAVSTAMPATRARINRPGMLCAGLQAGSISFVLPTPNSAPVSRFSLNALSRLKVEHSIDVM